MGIRFVRYGICSDACAVQDKCRSLTSTLKRRILTEIQEAQTPPIVSLLAGGVAGGVEAAATVRPCYRE